VANEVRNASRAVGRGANGEALVHLWNAVEPARIAGDVSALRTIAGIAQRIRAQGDEAEAREADRLLSLLRGAVDHEGGVAPATARLDADVTGGGEMVEDFEPAAEGEQEQAGRGLRIGNLIWLALIVLIILINVVGNLGDGG
jgi:hypothetical protein